MKTITIIGAGMMGSALAFPARENGNTVRLVGTPLDREIIDTCRTTGRHPKFVKDFPAGLEYYQIEQVKEAIEGADFIICGVSSFGVEWYAENILPILHENVPMISVTKGLMDMEDGTLITYLDFWQKKLDELGKNIPLNAIGGPCTSYELVAHDQTEVAFCGKDLDILRMIKSAMTTSYYHISLSTDIVGVESAVALKNGYALGIALTIGLNAVVLLLSVGVVMWVRTLYLDVVEKMFPSLDAGGCWVMIAVGVLLFVAVSFFNVVAIRKKVLSLF